VVVPPTDPGQPLAGPGWRLLATDAPPLHVPGERAALAGTPEELADLMLGRPLPAVDLERDVVVAFVWTGNACPERLVTLRLDRDTGRIDPAFESPGAGCDDVAVRYRFLVAVERAAIPPDRVAVADVPLPVHEPGDTALPPPPVSLPADLERLLAAAVWATDTSEGPVVGTYGTAGVPLARDGAAIPRASLAWGRAYLSEPAGVARVDERTGARESLGRRRDGLPIGERFTVDRDERLLYHVRDQGAVDAVDLTSGTAVRVIDAARPYDRRDPFLWGPDGDRLVVVGCEPTACASDTVRRGQAAVRLPRELEPLAAGRLAVVARHVATDAAVLLLPEGQAEDLLVPDLIDRLHAAHTLPDDRFLLSGHGPDDRYRLVLVGDDEPRVILERAAAFGLDHREVLLSPDWLLVGRWDPADAVEAGGERPLAIDLRTGTIVTEAGAVALCAPEQVPCPPE
jgi:hypothetical protein